jgi:hypothetical protein
MELNSSIRLASIYRMIAIDWPTIDADFGIIATSAEQALAAVVAWCTQGLQRPHPESIPIAMVFGDVVGDGCALDSTELEAHLAQRVLA